MTFTMSIDNIILSILGFLLFIRCVEKKLVKLVDMDKKKYFNYFKKILIYNILLLIIHI